LGEATRNKNSRTPAELKSTWMEIEKEMEEGGEKETEYRGTWNIG